MYAVLFDLEGTLVESPTKNHEVLSAFRQRLNTRFAELCIPSNIMNFSKSTALMYNNALDYIEMNFSSREREVFQRKIDEFMTEHEVAWAFQSKPFAHAYSVLSQLKQLGYRIALVSNTSKKAAEIMLSEGRLDKFFNVIVTRSDVKKLKPDPEGILLALGKIGLEKFFFVGDSELDALASSAVGGTSIIIKNDVLKRNFHANFFVESLSEVPACILPQK
jgi:HAD superfamily hydrolase (TIGR01549 family)